MENASKLPKSGKACLISEDSSRERSVREGTVKAASTKNQEQITNNEKLKEFFLLDVRTPQEFSDYHIPNSELIPITEIPQNLDKLKQIKKPILIICRSGARATHVQKYLQEQEIKSQVLQGGIISNKHLLKS